MFPVNHQEWRALSIQVKILPEKTPRLMRLRRFRIPGIGNDGFVTKCLDIAGQSSLERERALKRWPIIQTAIPVNRTDTLAKDKPIE